MSRKFLGNINLFYCHRPAFLSSPSWFCACVCVCICVHVCMFVCSLYALLINKKISSDIEIENG